jgi:hypothetical protein
MREFEAKPTYSPITTSIDKNEIVMTVACLGVHQKAAGRATYRPCGPKITAGVISEGTVYVSCFGLDMYQVTLHIIAFIMVKLGCKDIPSHQCFPNFLAPRPSF